MIATEDAEILLALGRATRDSAAWADMLALLCRQLQANRATLFTDGVTHGTPLPCPACFAALRPNRVYTAEELSDRAAPFDPDFSTGDHRVIATQAPRVCLWLHRQRGTFRAADSARLSGLIAHIAQAVALGQDRAALVAALAQAQAVQWRAGLGLVGPDGPDSAATRLLTEAGSPVPAIAPGALASLPGGLSAHGLPDGGILLRAPRALPAADRLAIALGLTRSEAGLARALALGQSLQSASAALGLTRETGRSYAKQIYAKTGVSGQSGLMRHIWSSALPFG